MLKTNVGYSILNDSYENGVETAKKTINGLNNPKLALLYSSVLCDHEKLIQGVKSVKSIPVVGCTSSGGIIVQDGIITGENGFSGAMMFDDENLTVGVAGMQKDGDAREMGRKIALEAIKNANTDLRPSYFYMVSSPAEEESYLKGIQDVIGRVPMFGGSAADNDVEGNWKIICNDKVISDGVAVAFFYTDNEITTSFTGAYNETSNMGLITEVKNNRTLVSIDGVSALKKYAHWTNVSPNNLKGKNLLVASITKPLGVKDPLGNLTVIRHPMFGNDQGTRTTSDDTITLGNKVVEGTAIIQLEATVDELINSTSLTMKNLKKQLYTEPAAYLLIHCGGRRAGIADRIDEVHKNILKEARGVPFIVPFTFGEYGYDEHSANICGGLMLSFTVFGKN